MQKDALLRSNETKPESKPKTVSKPIPKPALSPSPEPENPEDAFWSTPAASARTLRFTDRLLEEDPDFAELSAISFDSPGPAPPKSVFARLAAGSIQTNKDSGTQTNDDVFGGPQAQEGKDEDAGEDLRDDSSLFEVQLEPELDPEIAVPDAPEVETEDNPEEEATVVLSKVTPSAPADPPLSLSEDTQPQTSMPPSDAQSSSEVSSSVTKVRVTPELENIVASVALSTLLPGPC